MLPKFLKRYPPIHLSKIWKRAKEKDKSKFVCVEYGGGLLMGNNI